MDNRWNRVLGIVLLISLAANGWLYRQISSLQKVPSTEVVAAPASSSPNSENKTQEETRQRRAAVVIPQFAASSPVNSDNENQPEPRSEEECKVLREERQKSNQAEQLQKLFDPAEREKMKQDNIRMFGMQYSGAAESMGVSDELVDRLKELDAEYQLEKTQQYLEGALDASELGYSYDELDINPWIVSEQGYETARKWEESKQESMMNSMLSSITGLMATADEPLTAEQRQQYFNLQREVQKELSEQQEAENKALSINPASVEGFIAQQEYFFRSEQQKNQLIEQRAGDFLSDKQMQVLKRNNQRSLESSTMMVEQIRAQQDKITVTLERDENGCVSSFSMSGGGFGMSGSVM